tara:strand:+ start:58941 stop:59768 length:828 start_codon:yes stop_codon:yes gene_type:complete
MAPNTPYIERHINVSEPLQFQDLDWEKAAAIGLTEGEKTILKYTADVEGQTIFYLQEVLGSGVVRDSETMTFLTIWNYEEFFHGHAIEKLLAACNVEVDIERRSAVRMDAKFAAKAEAAFQWCLARLMPQTFKALYLSWAASQEYLTRLAYKQICETTKNPVLETLCRRIARQESRHFAWYYRSARLEIGASKPNMKVVRFLFEKFWTPVGVGVKSKDEARELVSHLFPGEALFQAMDAVDHTISKLPGLEGLSFARSYATSLVEPAQLSAPQPA